MLGVACILNWPTAGCQSDYLSIVSVINGSIKRLSIKIDELLSDHICQLSCFDSIEQFACRLFMITSYICKIALVKIGGKVAADIWVECLQ